MIRPFLILTLTLVLVTAVAPAFAGQVKVTLRETCEVNSAEPIKVTDIASIQPLGKTADKLGDVVVGMGPLPGANRTIDAGYVKLKLNAARIATEISVAGASSVTVTGKSIKLSPETLSEQAREFVVGALPQDNCTYEVNVERAPRELVLPDRAGVTVRPRLLSSALRPGPIAIALEALSNGRIIATTSAGLRIRAVAEALVTTATIRQGEPLTSANTTWEQREVTRTNDAITVAEQDNLQVWVARRLLTPGKAVTKNDVTLPPAIRRGDVVTLTIKCGKVTLRSTAEARQDARLGDSVSVRTPVSKEDVRARVVAPGQVEINRQR